MVIGIVAALSLAPHRGEAQDRYPSKPIRMLVGYAPGGPADLIARSLSQGISASLGQSVVVENRSGANGSIADGLVARSAPDGYTLLVQGTAISMNPTLIPNISFDALKELAPISLFGDTQYLIVVHPSVPAKTLREFIDFAKQRKGELMYGAPSSPSIVATTMMNKMAGIDVVRVPYRGAGLAIPGLLAGDVHMMISSIGPLLPYVKAGKVRAMAVSGEKRTSLAPDIPTANEAGLPGFLATTWYGVFAPAGTSRAIIDRLNTEVRKVVADSEVKKRFFAQGFDLAPSTPEEFGKLLRTEEARWGQAVKDAGLAGAQQ
ncbi:MAG: tripartite tricarboxylate transporter substrate binding protein [Hyphomicrobiales bacterium]|nr:tripartite tricarboxylate transporter substrate binding protein [Hyphomicrobiales bacterium]